MLKKNDNLYTAFDRYIILGQIGAGGNGTVYKVQNENGIICAAKVICKNDVSKEKIKRFKNEIGFCQKYDNDYIIKVIDYGYSQAGDKEYLFYIMPYYEYSLRKRISDGLNIETAVQIFMHLCEGLRFAHSKGCIHRDIKPENILIKSVENNCVIADFGIAHFMDDDKKTTVETKETSRLANFTYHAPEQASAGYSPEPTTDIFALGLILNEMITGSVPAGENYKKIADINSDYYFLDKIVSKMICQNPSDRYQSIDTLLLDYTARKRQAEQEKKIATLKEPLLQGEIHDSLTNNPPKAIEIKYDRGLSIKLSNSVNSKWERFYENALNGYTAMPYCYKNFRFSGCVATYSGNISNLSQNEIQKLVKDFQTAVSNANRSYASWLVLEAQRKQQEEIAYRQAEIQRLEKENDLNNFLKGLI